MFNYFCAFIATIGIGYGVYRLYRSNLDTLAKVFGLVLFIGFIGMIWTVPLPNGATVIFATIGLGVLLVGSFARWNSEWWHFALPIAIVLLIGVPLWWPVISGVSYTVPTFPPVKSVPIVEAPAPTYAPEPPATSSRVTRSKKAERVEEEDKDDPCPPDSGYSYGYRKAAGCFD